MKTVCIVEDHQVALNALNMLLESTDKFTVIGMFKSADDYIDRFLDLKPDIVIMDLHLPGVSGIESIALTKAVLPSVKILVMTMYDDDDQKIFEAFRAGADGYITKSETPEKVIAAMDLISEGGVPMTPVIARKVITYFLRARSPYNFSELTPKEKTVLELLVDGLLYKEIAVKMGLSIDAIKKHAHNIFVKLQVRTRSEAIRKYFSS